MKTKKTTLLIILILVVSSVFGQSEKLVGGKKLIQKDSKWYLKQEDDEFLLNNIITVFVGNQNLTDIKADLRQINGTIIRINKLGYADIKISDETLLSKLDSISLMENFSYDLNTYGKYTINPNDNFYLSSQFSYLSQIQLPSAWNFTLGSNCVTVAILDSGVDWLHEDLGFGNDTYRNIWFNSGEDDWGSNPNGGDGLDNDNNGFIDDYLGWDFHNDNNDSRGSNDHGTGVAGIVSAKTNNSKGVAGVAGGNNSQGTLLMPIGVGDMAPNGAVLDDAIIYAVDNGAKVIQLSLSVSQSNAIDAAIDYARQNNVSIVCASGNSNLSVSYPASNSKVLAVGSVDSNNQKSTFSNFGSELDVVAPGENIYTTKLSDSYGVSSGTSFAAPFVSGVITLMLNINFNLTPLEIEQIVKSTALDINTTGFDNLTGYGLIDAQAAVQAALPTLSGPSLVCTSNSTFTLSNPGGGTVSWSRSSNLTLVSSNSTSAIVRASSSRVSGNGWVRATITSDCGSVDIQEDFWVGKPGYIQTNPTGVPAIEASISSYVTITATSTPAADAGSLTWWTNNPSALSLSAGGNICIVECLTTGYNYVYVTTSNQCGISLTRQIPINVVGSGGGGVCCPFPQLVISPNPIQGQDELSIDIINFSEIEDYYGEQDTSYKIELFSMDNELKYTGSLNKNGVKVNLKHLGTGLYLINIIGRDFKETHRIIIE